MSERSERSYSPMSYNVYSKIAWSDTDFVEILKHATPSFFQGINEWNSTLLMELCLYTQRDTHIKLLIEYGREYLGVKESKGNTALMIACGNNRLKPEIIKYFLDFMTSEDISVVNDYGENAFMIFVKNIRGYTKEIAEIIDVFLRKTVEPFRTDRYNRNVCMLYSAHSECDSKILIPLLAAGGNRYLHLQETSYGDTLLMTLCRTNATNYELIKEVFDMCSDEIRQKRNHQGKNAFHKMLANIDRVNRGIAMKKIVELFLPHYDLYETCNKGNNALMISHEMHVETILKAAKDPLRLLEHRNHQGNNALMHRLTGDGEAERFLQDKEAMENLDRNDEEDEDAEEIPYGKLPNSETIQLYIKYGAGSFIGIRNANGNHALLITAIIGSGGMCDNRSHFFEILKILLNAGGYRHLEQANSLGYVATDYLHKKERKQFEQLLGPLREKEATEMARTLLRVEKTLKLERPIPFDVMMTIAAKSANMNEVQTTKYLKTMYAKHGRTNK